MNSLEKLVKYTTLPFVMRMETIWTNVVLSYFLLKMRPKPFKKVCETQNQNKGLAREE